MTTKKKLFSYEYPRPALTVDGVIFGLDATGLKILLIRRRDEPFKNSWALPGGFVNMDETTDQAVARELEEETSIKDLYLEQLYTFSGVHRDPRERVVSVAYYGLVKPEDLKPVAGDDAKEVRWFDVTDLPTLAFDHAEVVAKGLERIRGKVRYQPIGFELLPPKFTLPQLQQLYEHVLGRELNDSNFRKKVKSLGLLTPLGESSTQPWKARLYEFDREAYNQKVQAGFNFEI